MGPIINPIGSKMGQSQKISLLVRTVSYLKAVQIINRIKRKFISAKVDESETPKARLSNVSGFYFIERPRSYLSGNNFLFLNKNEKLLFPLGWNDPKLPKLWLYNLHYFEGLLNADTPNSLKEDLIHQWIEQNSPGQGNGWEPYPNSLRIVNWIKWALLGNQLSESTLHSLAVQVRYLTQTVEFHLLGNHLFANAKALVFAGLFFEGPDADNWFAQGFEILEKQIPEQFLRDGAHFELSTTYHALLTEDLLDIIQFMLAADKNIPNAWIKTAQRALNWLIVITRPDGLPPLFNDAAYKITPSLKEIKSLATATGLIEIATLKSGITDLNESGYFRYESDRYSFLGDAGQIGPKYIPGHAHCDMLNFELFAHGKPIIVDTGTSTYETCERRFIERGTVSHNTVQVEGEEQSEIWGAFRVARRAKITKREVKFNSVFAECKGYKKPKKSHRRKFSFEDNLIIIDDQVNQSELSVARLHFHPDVSVTLKGNFVTAGPLKIEIINAEAIDIKDYKYAPEFNKLLKAEVLEVSFIKNIITKIIL